MYEFRSVHSLPGFPQLNMVRTWKGGNWRRTREGTGLVRVGTEYLCQIRHFIVGGLALGVRLLHGLGSRLQTVEVPSDDEADGVVEVDGEGRLQIAVHDGPQPLGVPKLPPLVKEDDGHSTQGPCSCVLAGDRQSPREGCSLSECSTLTYLQINPTSAKYSVAPTRTCPLYCSAAFLPSSLFRRASKPGSLK